jgi:Flp pilus assembly protein TadD
VPNSSELLSAALSRHKAGEFSEAVFLYREILSKEPQHADALHLLGVLCNQLGNADLAVDLITKSIEISPRVTEYHNNLGNALKARGDRSARVTL